MKYRCMIVDDKPLAIEVIRTYVENTGTFDIAAECRNAAEAFSVLSAERIDLMFLDIQMPGLKGIDFLKSLVHPPLVIMTTAYREYALDGFELGVIDYLLKPISMERFLKAIDKFTHRIRLETELPEKSTDPREEGFIYLSVNKKIYKILVGDILYAESAKDYLTLHTVSGKIVAKHTISSLEALLQPKEFIRIHRSFIVSVSKIKGFTAHHIDMGHIELPIGPNYQKQVFQKLKYPME